MNRKKTTFFSNQTRFFVVSLLCSLLFATSCKDDDKGSNGLKVNNGNTITFDSSTFCKEASVDSNSPWEVVESSTPEWVQPIIKENSLVLLLAPNPSTNNRKGSVEIKNKNGKIQVLNIEQDPTNVNLKIVSLSDTIWLNYHQTEYTFYIYSKTDWTLSSNDSWLTTDKTSGVAGSHKIIANFSKNTDKDARKAIITLSAGEANSTIEVAQRGEKDFDDATYKFYINLATLPVLYTGLMIVDDETPSYLIDRRETLQKDKLPSHVTPLSYDDFPNNIIDIIRSIEAKDPEATYAYYGEDMRIHEYLPIFTRLGIDTSRVKLTILPDGSGTYVTMFSTPYGEDGKGSENYKKEKVKIEKAFSDYTANPSLGYYDTKANSNTDADYNAPHILAQYHHARYYIQDMDYLITHDSYVQNEITKNNYIVQSPRELLDKLSSSKQNEFYDLVGFDLQTNLDLLAASPKSNLIILGTNTAGASSPEDQAKYVQRVIDFFPTYDIFFKAHPADKAYLDYENRFPGLKLIKPAAMPFDVFTWALNDQIHALGGYNSTVFLTVPTDKVKFMFAKDASSLGSELYYNIFNDRTDIYWINLD